LSQLGIEGAHPGGINLTKKIFERENVNKNSHILDVGCGTGQTVAYLARKFGAHVTGIDINSIMVEKAKKRMKEKRIQANVIQCTVEKLPFLDNQFDFVISESVLSFVDTSSALNEIYRVLKRGGRLIAIELTMKHPLSEKEEDAIKQFYGFNSLTLKKDWEVRLKQAGFDHIRIKKNTSTNPTPVFHNPEGMEPELYEILEQHLEYSFKYQGILEYRIYSCTK